MFHYLSEKIFAFKDAWLVLKLIYGSTILGLWQRLAKKNKGLSFVIIKRII